MTNNEAIERLQRCIRNLEFGKVIGAVSGEGVDERIEAYGLAIKALEEQPQDKWIRLDLAKEVIAKFRGYLDEDMVERIQIALEKENEANMKGNEEE